MSTLAYYIYQTPQIQRNVMEENNNKLIIVLRDSNDAQAFTPQNLIHNSEFDRAKKWIKKQAKDAEQAINSNEYTPKYNTISILGTRGSGKTTFMKSLLKYEWEEEGIQKIGILDPTLIEEKGHPFLTIIAEINRLVISHYDKMDIYNNRLEIPKSLWEEHLKKLSEGLPTLETIEAGFEKWQDPEYIMKIGLKRVKAARDLSQNFHNLLKTALAILHKKAFIIALDDIDVDFLRGWPVLETLRKYLTTPFIITLLSGDLELYSMAIRKQQWKNFGKSLLVNEGEYLKRHHDFDDMVTQMEEQYMLKVLSPNYRIHLRTLLEKKLVEIKDTKICIDTSQLIQDIDSKETNTTEQNLEKPIIEIEVAYQEQLKKLGMENPTEREVYINFLLGMPIRSQIRLLTALYSAQENNIEAWTDIFLSEMYILDADIDLIRAYPAYTTIVMLRFLQSQNLLTRAYKFQPTLQQFNINAVLFALTATFATYSDKHPYLLFDYLIRIGLPLSLQDGGILSAQNIELSSLINFAKLTQVRGLSNCCGDIIAYTQGLFKDGKGQLSLSRSLGLLTLAGLAEKAKTNPKRNKGRIDYELSSKKSENSTSNNTITNLQRAVAYLPISISIAPWKQSTIVTASFYRLLACIGEILKRNTINKNNNANTPTEEQKSAISSTILDLGSLKTHTIPLFDNTTTDSLPEYSDSEIHEGKIENELDRSFIESVWTWMNSSSCETFSPNIIDRILSRMQRSIPLISNNTDIQNLGDAMHRYIISFFNAVLYETSAETYPDIELNRGNSISNDKILNDNIKQLEHHDKERPPLAEWIFTCPLLLCFLKKDETEAIVNDKNRPQFYLYDHLGRVTLPDRKIKATSEENLQKNIEKIYNYITNFGVEINREDDLKEVEEVDWGKRGNDERRSIFNTYYTNRRKGKTHDKAFELAFSNNNDKTNSSK